MNDSGSNHVKENRGIQIVMKGDIKKQNDGHYQVQSQSNQDTWYDIIWEKNHWACNCIDHQQHNHKCKHIFAVNYFLTLENIKNGLKKNDNDVILCPKCKSNKNIIKRGKLYNRSGVSQRYYCKDCDKKFSGKKSFRNMKHRADIIALSLDLYFRGLSLRGITQHLEIYYKTKVTHATIAYWIKKYVTLLNEHMDKLCVNSSDRWLADETIINVRGRHMKLWALLDSESRFLLATHISEKRGITDAKKLLKKGVSKSINLPLEIATDGLSSYNDAIKSEIRSKDPIIHLQGPLNKAFNNKIERFNGIIKSRTKTMGTLYDEDSMKLFFNGFNIYYNYIKVHSSLNNQTPAQAIGIATEKYDWLSLIDKIEHEVPKKRKDCH